MKKLLLTLLAGAGAAALLPSISFASSSTVCTDKPQSAWMSADAFKAKAKGEGYEIKTFKVTKHCYEIYGKKDGKKVEVYFNPVTGAVFKSH